MNSEAPFGNFPEHYCTKCDVQTINNSMENNLLIVFVCAYETYSGLEVFCEVLPFRMNSKLIVAISYTLLPIRNHNPNTKYCEFS